MSAYDYLSAALSFMQGMGWGGALIAAGVFFVIGAFMRTFGKH